MTDTTALDAQLAAAPDAPSRAALLGIDFAAFERTSNRLRTATVVIAIGSALSVVGLGVLIEGITFESPALSLALGLVVGLVPFLIGAFLASAVVQGVRGRTTLHARAILGGVLSAGLAALLAVAAARLLLPLGEAVELGLAAGMAVGAAIPVLSIALLPAAFRRVNPKLAAAIEEFRALPAHKTTLNGRFAHIVADHAAWQFPFIALVPLSVASTAAGVVAALVLAGVCALTTELDLRARPAASLLVSIAAAGAFLAAAIIAVV